MQSSTLVLGACLAYLAFRFASWALVNAIWTLPPDAGSTLCRAARGEGACWAVIHERFRFILVGGYPYDAQWRPAVACALFVSLYAVSTRRAWWTPGCWCCGSLSQSARSCCSAAASSVSPTCRPSSGADCR